MSQFDLNRLLEQAPRAQRKQRNAYNRLSPYHTTWNGDSSAGYVVYHQTGIVEWTPDEIVLNTGGYRSATTKKKMNQASHQFGLGFAVSQRNFDWYVTRPDGSEVLFEGNIMRIARKQW